MVPSQPARAVRSHPTPAAETCFRTPFPGTLAYGSPIGFREGDAWKWGVYLAAGAKPGQAWVLFHGARLVDAPAPIQLTRIYKQGEKVWASYVDQSLRPAVVTKVIGAGVAYAVRFVGEKDVTTIGFDGVTAPLTAP